VTLSLLSLLNVEYMPVSVCLCIFMSDYLIVPVYVYLSDVPTCVCVSVCLSENVVYEMTHNLLIGMYT